MKNFRHIISWKALLILLALALLSMARDCYAQNYRSDGVVQSRSGYPAPGALVAVCTQPCTVPSNVSISTPPSPLASLCSSSSDATCTSPNPVTADGLGNYHFFVKPGKYTVVTYGSGLTAFTQTDVIFPCDPSNCLLAGILTQSAAAKFTETTAPTCALAFDFLWGDSTAHRLKQCDNNGSALQIVNAGVDINTSDQVTGTNGATLPLSATALATNASRQVIAATVQGNGSKVQLSTGTTTTNDFVSYDANGNAVDSGKALPSGAVASVPTFTLKKGTGAGNYTSTSLTPVVVDGTNLAYTVTIPTGWKLSVQASGTIGSNTAPVTVAVSIADGGVRLQEVTGLVAATGVAVPFSISYVITGDGASHTIDLRFFTTNAADAVAILNGSSIQLPTMVFILSPSS